MGEPTKWSVWWGTSWWILDATSEAQARRLAFNRLSRLTRYHLPYRATLAERVAQEAEFMAKLRVRPATPRECETYAILTGRALDTEAAS